MTVLELIKELNKLPSDAKVWTVWDSAARSQVDLVWLSKDGRAILCDKHEMDYLDSDELPETL